tara:strand:- start:7400 stop:7966 length:567 start_codon:yes stop_codon:yes gene_type:complete
MSFSWNRFNRKIHYWGAIICAIPVLVIIGTGIILLLKKDIAWIQPPTQRGASKVPMLPFERILAVSQAVPEADISDWNDVDRLDVRPSKGIVKVRAENRWEIQIDNESGEVLQVAFRRSDLIESIHDGSWFHDKAKLWVFLPSAVLLFILWITGIVLFLQPFGAKRKRKQRQRATAQQKLGATAQATN